MKRFAILCFSILSLNLCFASNNDEHLRSFTIMIDARNFQGALNEMPLISNWTNDDNLPQLDIRGISALIAHTSFYYPASDRLWHDNHFDSLLVYLIPYVKQYMQSCRTEEDYSSAEQSIESLMDFVELQYGRKHPFYIYGVSYLAAITYVLNDTITSGMHYFALGQLYMEKGQNDRALDSFHKAFSLLRHYKKGVSEELRLLSNAIGKVYLTIGKHEAAKTSLMLSLEISKKLYGDKSPEYSLSLYNLGVIEKNYGQYKTAEKYISNAREIFKQHDICDTIYIGLSTMGLGGIYEIEGKYEAALAEYLDAIHILEEYSKGITPELGEVYNHAGRYYHTIGDLFMAHHYSIKSEEVYRQVLLDTLHSSLYAEIEGNLGQIYRETGLLKKAEEKYNRALSIIKNIYGEEHSAYAIVLGNLSQLYLDKGQYKEAYICAQKAYSIYQKTLPENHPYFTSIFLQMGQVQSSLGNYQKAKEYNEKALNFQKNICDSCMEYVQCLIQTANICNELEEYKESVDLLNQAIPIIEKNSYIDSPYALMVFNMIGSLYSNELGNDSALDEAEQYYLTALDIMDSLPSYQQDNYGAICNNLGVLSCRRGYYDKALYYHKKALDKTQKLKTSNHIHLAIVLTHIGYVYYKKQDYENAAKYAIQGSDMFKNIFMNTWDYMPEKMREDIWETNSYLLIYTIPPIVYNYAANPKILQWAYDNELFMKGAVVSSGELIKRSLSESGDTLLQRKWEELVELKSKLYQMQERNSDPQDIKEYLQLSEQLEQEITVQSSVFRNQKLIQKTTWEDVRKQLKKKEVALEFMMAPLTDNDTTIYCALLLRDSCSAPILIPMFYYHDIAKEFYLSNENRISYLGNEENISQLVWRNILPYLKKGETVYFAPSGLLHQVAIENLPYDSTRTMSDVFNMVRVSSTRELVSRPKAHRNKTAALYGGIYYSVNLDELTKESDRYSRIAPRALMNDTINRGQVTYLRGTQKEIEDIRKKLQSKQIHVLSYDRNYATEESFKALSGTHTNIIHIATHGFYWEDYTAKKEKFFTQRASYMDFNISIDPMERCGLLFTGANIALSGHSNRIPEGVQDGILTAKEISIMDLRDADIVVLSACETGLGDISGEGVFGLQRAFKMAGVRSILMSLWKVDDKATQMLMTSFYRHYNQGKTKYEALRHAQQELRENGYESAYYWAGFVLLD